MSELNQPPSTQAAPVYTPPTLSGQPSFFGRLLQGALLGLSGGLAQGQTNVAGAGTPGFNPVGGGLSYAEKLQQQQDQKRSKDPYKFDFLMLGTDSQERDLERGLLEHLRQFLLELGIGFALLAANTGFR